METVTHIQGSPSSSLTPLFLIHAAAGSALSYFALGPLADDSAAEKAQRPVYGISSPFYRQKNYRLPHSLEEVARQYIALIQELQPRGPYLLGGWSMGGMIAVKMARLLRAQGEAVLHVILVDSADPAAAPSFCDKAEHDAVAASLSAAVLKRLGIPAAADAAEPDDDSSGSDTDDDDELTNMAVVVAKVQKYISNSVQLIANERADERTSSAAARNQFPVTLVKCAARPPPRPAGARAAVRDARRAYERKVFHEDTMGWDAGLFERFTVLRFSASHDAAFDPPYAGELTAHFKTILSTIHA